MAGRPQERSRSDGLHERADREGRCATTAIPAPRALRRAAELKTLRNDIVFFGAVRQAGRGGLQGLQAPAAPDEHDLRRHRGRGCWASTADRSCMPSGGSSEEAESDRAEPRRPRRGLSRYARRTCRSRIPAGSSRWTRRRGNDPHRGQRRGGARLHVRPASPWSRWYPITPSSSLPESLIDYMKQYRNDGDREGHVRRSCRPRTKWRRSGWSSARAGPARGR